MADDQTTLRHAEQADATAGPGDAFEGEGVMVISADKSLALMRVGVGPYLLALPHGRTSDNWLVDARPFAELLLVAGRESNGSR